MMRRVRASVSLGLVALLAGSSCTRIGGEGQLDPRTLFSDLPVQASDEAGEAGAALTFQAAGFRFRIPEDGATVWSLGLDSEGALLARTLPDGTLTALIYLEAVSPLMAERPAEEMARFELSVDPRLAEDAIAWPSTTTEWVEALGRSGEERRSLRRLAWMMKTRTGGRGFGYASSPGTFSGWRWVGLNSKNVLLRLARTTGRWSEQAELPEELDRALRDHPGKFEALASLYTAGAPSTAGVEAQQAIGLASAGESGVHLALVTLGAPEAARSQELAAFLSSIERAEGGRDRSPPAPSVEELAGRLGIALLRRN
ncbi:MAG TPA: hypothetical protein VN783_14390 [Thermoanaerobaculia bacterium]|nr:hypothetical protein [Thermoanaerobaculia bacterium]